MMEVVFIKTDVRDSPFWQTEWASTSAGATLQVLTNLVVFNSFLVRYVSWCKRLYHFLFVAPDQPKDSCPSLGPMPMCVPKMFCTNDSECADGEKCCLRRDCTKRCYTLAKAGQCPKTDPKPCPAILRPPECATDWDCAGELKCCSDGCIKKCTSSFVRQKEGMVWFYKLQIQVTY